MYEPGTILSLKEKRSTAKEPFPYDRVRVVARSPLIHAHKDYAGPDSAGVVIQPLEGFDGTIDEPFGKLRALYDVETLPVRDEAYAAGPAGGRTTAAPPYAPTPEEAFEKVAEEKGEVKQAPKVKKQALPDVPKPSSSPLS